MKRKLQQLFVYSFLLSYGFLVVFFVHHPTAAALYGKKSNDTKSYYSNVTTQDLFSHTLPTSTALKTLDHGTGSGEKCQHDPFTVFISADFFYYELLTRFNYLNKQRYLTTGLSNPDIVFPFHYFL